MTHTADQPSPLAQKLLELEKLRLSDFLDSPNDSFFTWTEAQLIAESTKTVKRAMWNKFIRWMTSKQLTLALIELDHLDSFFQDEKIQKAHRRRYLKLIERVYVFLHDLGLSGSANPATEAKLNNLGEGMNAPTVFLDQAEKERVEQVILNRLRENGREARKVEKEGQGRKKQTWILARDAVIAATMLGVGAAVASVQSLTVNCTNYDQEDNRRCSKISLSKEGGGQYQAVALPIAQTALSAWFRLRFAKEGIGDQMFPAELTYRQHHAVNSPQMHPATIFRAAKSVLKEAGITGRRACGQTLRNTYAATLIEMGFDDQALADNMGFINLESAIRLRHQYTGKPVDEARHPERKTVRLQLAGQ